MPRRLNWRLVAGLGAFATVAAVGAWSLVPRSQAHPAEDSARPVAVVDVKRGDLMRTATFSAELNPYQEADLHAKVAGYLKTINVDIGDRAKKGDVLAMLDIAELRDDLSHARAAYHDADLNYQRIRQVVAARPGLLAQAEVDNAEASFEMAKANLERAQTMYGYATIAAPFDGVITKRYVDPGALVQAGTNSNSQALPVVHIADDTTLRLLFPVPEALVPQISVGTPVDVSVEATGQHISSKIARITGKLDTSTRTMETEVDLDNHDHRMTPGMYADARVVLQSKHNVMVLPIQAVSAGEKPTVWVVDKTGALQERPVELGMKTDKDVEVVNGVAQGDQVVIGSRSVLALGSHVVPKQVVSR
jgi:RND family efflux transporter MFP subunit